jgi:N-acetylglutamate synthase-like GNAT family acetyltransferase
MTTVIAPHVNPIPGLDVVYRRFRPADIPGALSMLGRCSRETLFRRFHGATDGVFHVRDLARRSDHVTIGAWTGSACIGLATLGTDDSLHDIGVLVEDAWHAYGVGSSLLTRLVGIARVAGIDEVHADVLAESAWALRILRRVGRAHADLCWGVYSVRVELDRTEPLQPTEGKLE